MKKSIKFKIILSFCILMIFVIAGQIVFNLFYSQTFFRKKKEKQLLNLYTAISENYTDDAEKLNSITTDDENIHGFSVIVLSDKQVIYSTRKTPINMNKTIIKVLSDKDKIISETPIIDIIDLKDDNMKILTAGGKIDFKGENRYIFISLPMQSIKNSAMLFTQSSIIISSVILVIGIVIAVFLAKSISKPIKNIELVSKRLCALDFSYHADENISSTELKSLAISINEMSRQLESNIIMLNNANEKLQKDVDYQKKIEAMRRQFIANVSHEMKTPLSLLQLYSENLKNNIDGIDRNEYCDTIIEETQHLSNMVKDMLDMSSIENGLLKMHIEPLDLSSLIEKTVSKFSVILNNFNTQIQIEKNVMINGDEKYITQAVSNYISNAIAHTITNGNITIFLTQNSENTIFKVYNDGKKIAQEDLKRIWESFYKSDKARTRTDNENSGLGLYIVKTIIDKHNGTYNVENKDTGVEFSFTLKTI